MTEPTKDRPLMEIVVSMMKLVNFEQKAPAQFKRDLKKLCETAVEYQVLKDKVDDGIPF